MVTGPDSGDPPLRVLVVDDSLDIRTLLGLMLRRDGRFEVVGEAVDGRQAIELAGRLQPDLVVLDRQMPGLGGIEAMPGIREACPNAEIVLYTAAADPETETLALHAGAIGTIQKQAIALGVGERLAELLARRWEDPEAEIEVKIGPVPAASARAWIVNTEAIVGAVRSHPEVVWKAIGGAVSDEVLDLFDTLLAAWLTMAETSEVFVWVGRMRPEHVRTVVSEWARLDVMDSATMEAIGAAWSGPEGRVFFEALTDAVVASLSRHDETRRLAERLRGQGWSAPR